MSLIDFMDESSELVTFSESKKVTEEDISNLNKKLNDIKSMKYVKSDYIKNIIHDMFFAFTDTFCGTFGVSELGTGLVFRSAKLQKTGLLFLVATVISVILTKVTEPKNKYSLLKQLQKEINSYKKRIDKAYKKASDEDKKILDKQMNEIKKCETACAKALKQVTEAGQYNTFDEAFKLAELLEDMKQVDYAPVNEPIEGDDLGDLPEEKQPDYVPDNYEKGTPKDNCSTCRKFASNFEEELNEAVVDWHDDYSNRVIGGSFNFK